MLGRKFRNLEEVGRWSFKTGLNTKPTRWLADLWITQKILALRFRTPDGGTEHPMGPERQWFKWLPWFLVISGMIPGFFPSHSPGSPLSQLSVETATWKVSHWQREGKKT